MTKNALSLFLNLFTPLETKRKASMSKPESVSSIMHNLGSSMAI